MKNFSNPMQENNPFNSPEPLTTARISNGYFNNVRFGGRHVGASMITGDSSGESLGICSINIYINNNVQGINNSVLIGSEVRMGDPGVSLCLGDLKMDRGFQMVSEKKEMDGVIGLVLLLLAFVMLGISVVAYLLV